MSTYFGQDRIATIDLKKFNIDLAWNTLINLFFAIGLVHLCIHIIYVTRLIGLVNFCRYSIVTSWCFQNFFVNKQCKALELYPRFDLLNEFQNPFLMLLYFVHLTIITVTLYHLLLSLSMIFCITIILHRYIPWYFVDQALTKMDDFFYYLKNPLYHHTSLSYSSSTI